MSDVAAATDRFPHPDLQGVGNHPLGMTLPAVLRCTSSGDASEPDPI